MKRGIWKVWALLLPIVTLIGACSGATDPGVDNQAQLKLEKRQAAEQRVAEWGKFVGISTEQARAELAEADLLDIIAEQGNLDRRSFARYVDLAFKHDAILQNGVDVLNELNQEAHNAMFFPDRSRRPGRPGFGRRSVEAENSGDAVKVITAEAPELIVIDEGNSGEASTEANLEAARRAYADLSAQATLVRGRLLQGVLTLGLELEPVSMRDLLIDELFQPIADDFAGQMMVELFGKKLQQATQQEKNFAAEPLAGVSFIIDGRVVSFYQFNARQGGAGFRTPTTRGEMRSILAEANRYGDTVIEERVTQFGVPDPKGETIVIAENLSKEDVGNEEIAKENPGKEDFTTEVKK